MQEDTIAGRYAATLFIAASKENNLFKVYEDLHFILGLYESMESFRIFCDNSGLSSNQINSFISDLSTQGEFCETTVKFCGKDTFLQFYRFIGEE